MWDNRRKLIIFIAYSSLRIVYDQPILHSTDFERAETLYQISTWGTVKIYYVTYTEFVSNISKTGMLMNSQREFFLGVLFV